MIKLSIIVPVYNSQNFISDALDCLKKQSENLLEFLIINDGSTDNSETIIKKIIADDNRFVYINKPINTGYGDTCNIGIKNSSGEYIAIFEPDDIIPNDFYCTLLEKVPLTQADIIKYNGIYRFEQNLENKTRIFRLKNFPNTKFYRNQYPRFWRTHPCIINAIYKRNFLDKNKIEFVKGSGASYQDVQFLVSLFYGNPSIVVVDECKYMYRQHENQSIKKIDEKILVSVTQNWYEFFSMPKLDINKNNSWFAIIQMYRQFQSLKSKISSKKDILEIFYTKSLLKYGIPSIKKLRWFNFQLIDIFIFYFFSVKVLSSFLIKKMFSRFFQLF